MLSSVGKNGTIYIPANEFQKLTGVNSFSARRYLKKGIIDAVRGEKKHNYYSIADADKIIKGLIDVPRPKHFRFEPVHVCYTLAGSDSEHYKIIYEEKMFKSKCDFFENTIIFREYGDPDDLEKPFLRHIIERCCAGQVVYFFVVSLSVLGKDFFDLIRQLLICCDVTLLIVDEAGEWRSNPKGKDEKDFYMLHERDFVNKRIQKNSPVPMSVDFSNFIDLTNQDELMNLGIETIQGYIDVLQNKTRVCYARIPLFGDSLILASYVKQFKQAYPGAKIVTEEADFYNGSYLMRLVEDFRLNPFEELVLIKDNIPAPVLFLIEKIAQKCNIDINVININRNVFKNVTHY